MASIQRTVGVMLALASSLAGCPKGSDSDEEVRPDTDTDWVTIPGGTFQMGSTTGWPNEAPVHTVTVRTFAMMKTEVTLNLWAECVAGGGCLEMTGCYVDVPDGDAPLTCVNWIQAREYCAWAGGRLPAEAEWEYAARSGGQPIPYPWGEEPATCAYAVMNEETAPPACGMFVPWAACSKPDGNTDQGLCDMAGNVWEWVEDDWHDGYDGAPEDGSAWVDDPRGWGRVARGGGFFSFAADVSTASRNNGHPGFVLDNYGFRCAR